MTATTKQIADMLDMLPLPEQEFACEVMRKLIIARDADYTKLTPKEAVDLRLAHEQVAKGEVFSDDEIDWNNLDKMDLG